MTSSTSLPKTMRALRVNSPGQALAPSHYPPFYTLESSVPLPGPLGPHDVLLRLGAAGLCHTDLMILAGEFPSLVKYPVTGSHEAAGTVVALGSEAVRSGNIKVGERVVSLHARGWCGVCPDCKSVDWKYCTHSHLAGFNVDGAFAEYGIYDSRLCVGLPDAMSFAQAAPLTCAGITMYAAIKRANLKPGSVLGIIGLGALGILGVQIAKAMGLSVVGVDARHEPIEIASALKLSPDIVVDATKRSAKQVAEEINATLRPSDWVGFDGADAVILTSDPVSSQRFAADLVRRHGLLVVVAQPRDLSFDFHQLIFRNITVVGSLHGNERDLAECVALCGEYGIESEVTVWTINEHEQMIQAQSDPGRRGKAVLVFE